MNTPSNAMEFCIHLEQEAADFGFKWPDVIDVLEQVRSECQEIQEAISNRHSIEHLQEEVGDLLQAALAVCFVCGFDINETLHKANEKFAKRFERVKQLTHKRGLTNLNQQSAAFNLDIWKQAKDEGIEN